MKQVENSFVITGFVAKDAEIRTFTNNDVARFPMAIGRKETKDNATNRVSAFINVEAWRRAAHRSSCWKGTSHHRGLFEAEEWTDKNGTKQNGIKLVAKKFYEAVEKPEKAEKPQPKTRAKETEGGSIDLFHLRKERLRPLFLCSMHLVTCPS